MDFKIKISKKATLKNFMIRQANIVSGKRFLIKMDFRVRIQEHEKILNDKLKEYYL